MAKKARKISLNTGANDRARLVMDHTIWRQAKGCKAGRQAGNRAMGKQGDDTRPRDRAELGPAKCMAR